MTEPSRALEQIAASGPPSQSGRRPERSADWGSLIADLSRGRSAPAFHVHDRTHVEFAMDFRLETRTERETFVWEAYLFAPESLRLDRRTYDKTDIYTDLQSYVRFEVPEVALADLAGGPAECVEKALRASELDAEAALREMRLFACQVRAAGVEARKRVFDALEQPEPKSLSEAQAKSEAMKRESLSEAQAKSEAMKRGGGTEPRSRGGTEPRSRGGTEPRSGRSLGLSEAVKLATEASRVAARMREVLAPAAELPEPVRTGARWIDEDVSRMLETLLASVSRRLADSGAPESVVSRVEKAALAEARYRAESGLGGVGAVDMDRREVEALEFRRHLLKRFTSSVLWLSPEVRPASTWVLQLLYSVAAGIAMAFAIIAALWNGFAAPSSGWLTWLVVGVLAYAVKDRIKASLQSLFSSVVERHFPDRRWLIRDRERAVVLGEMYEQSGFIAPRDLPSDVLEVRRLTLLHVLEEQARPETVLFHRKQVMIHADRVAEADARFTALTEIFRLDLRHWLSHTDDPKREILFADPVAGRVASAEAPRVYNIGIIYRLRRAGEDEKKAPWNRVRVVVTRKGIRRIDKVL